MGVQGEGRGMRKISDHQWRVSWRVLRAELRERAIDALLFAVPVFVVVGLVMACARFWWWLLCFR